MAKTNVAENYSASRLMTSAFGDGPDTFRLKVVGNSMEPKFSERDVLIFSNEVQPEPGDFVAILNGLNKFAIHEYRCGDALDQVNRSGTIVGTLIEHRRLRRESAEHPWKIGYINSDKLTTDSGR